MSEELMIKRDRMRFTKNTASSRLALLAIVLNVLFFVSIYKVNLSAYYTWLIGVSILYNLVFMLAAFLSSEGAKNYNIRYSFLLIILGIGQIIRIFIIPARMYMTQIEESASWVITKTVQGAGNEMVTQTIENRVMPSAQYTRVIIYLALSAACLIIAALINWIKSRQLTAHQAEIGRNHA